MRNTVVFPGVGGRISAASKQPKWPLPGKMLLSRTVSANGGHEISHKVGI